MIALNAEWLAHHPLPLADQDTDKNKRGRVLLAGGSVQVPGALRLSGEAALRAGAGKVQLATVEPAALGLGLIFPEAAVIALRANAAGELDAAASEPLVEAASRCDTLVLGPGTSVEADVNEILTALLSSGGGMDLILDAAFIPAVPCVSNGARAFRGEIVLTPHPGEMALLMGCEAEDLTPSLALDAADRFGATIIMKGPQTIVASKRGELLQYSGGGPGMATAGSGDVLAGLLGGLLARGTDVLVAAAWSVFLHGEAGKRVAGAPGATGFLARELLAPIPMLMERSSEAGRQRRSQR